MGFRPKEIIVTAEGRCLDYLYRASDGSVIFTFWEGRFYMWEAHRDDDYQPTQYEEVMNRIRDPHSPVSLHPYLPPGY